jgi:periplasmic divalent cation tolerance protein
MSATSALLVLTTLPDRAGAEALAAHLVELRLAACVSIQSPCTSIYRWQGAIERGEELQLLIKTSADRYAALAAAIVARHPYALPELIALPVVAGSPAYLDWIASETRPADGVDEGADEGAAS